jgi:hypothetical protein
VESQIAREIADAAASRDAFRTRVVPEDRRAARRRLDQVEEETDGGALARSVWAEVAEDLAALDAEVEIYEGPDPAGIRFRQAVRLDGRGLSDRGILRMTLQAGRFSAIVSSRPRISSASPPRSSSRGNSERLSRPKIRSKSGVTR